MKMNRNPKFCPKCGAIVAPHAKKCPNCGYNLQQYMQTHLPAVRKKHTLRSSKNGIVRHKLGLITGILIILFLVLGGYMATHRDTVSSFGPTPAQQMSKQLPHYSWVATAKNDEGGLNDTLLFLFNGRKVSVAPAVSPILKACTELSSNTDLRDKISDGVKNSSADYKISKDMVEINDHKTIKDVKKSGHHYDFKMKTKSGNNVEMVMKKYAKISPRLKN